MRRLSTRVAVVAIAVLLGSACGVGVESSPTLLDGQVDEPIALPDDVTAAAADAAVIFLVRDERLVPVARQISVDGDEGSVAALLEAVLAGPTLTEADAGVTTAIPPPTGSLGVDVDGRTVSVDLTDEFTAVGGIEEILAVGQIVLTLTDVAAVDAVVFALDGRPTVVPDGTGALVDRPVGAEDYLELQSP